MTTLISLLLRYYKRNYSDAPSPIATPVLHESLFQMALRIGVGS